MLLVDTSSGILAASLCSGTLSCQVLAVESVSGKSLVVYIECKETHLKTDFFFLALQLVCKDYQIWVKGVESNMQYNFRLFSLSGAAICNRLDNFFFFLGKKGQNFYVLLLESRLCYLKLGLKYKSIFVLVQYKIFQ